MAKGKCPTCSSEVEMHKVAGVNHKAIQNWAMKAESERLYFEQRDGLNHPMYGMDLDWIECKQDGTPAALIEFQVLRGAPNPPPSYFAALDRGAEWKFTVLRSVAEALDVPARGIVMERDGQWFWSRDLRDPKGEWRRSPHKNWARWLRSLPRV
jgi:hypothetical protein